MKSRILRTSVGALIFFLLIAAVFAFVQPIYRKTGDFLNTYVTKGRQFIEDNTGLTISYKSLSPSIITGVNLRGFTVSEKSTGKTILTVKRVKLSYRLLKLLHGDFEHCFTGLTLNGLNFTVSQKQLDKITSSSVSENASQNVSQKEKLTALDVIREVFFSFPFQVSFKNINVNYSNAQFTSSCSVKNLEMQKSEDGNSLSGNFKGNFITTLPSGKTTFGFSFSADGRLLKEISGSSAMVSVSSYNRADYSLGRSSYLLRYSDRQFDLRTIMGTKSFSFFGSLNMENQTLLADMQMNNFDPFQILVIRNPVQEIEQFRGIRLTAGANLSYVLSQNKLKWSTDGELSFPQSIAPEGEKAFFSVRGDNNLISIPLLKAEGSLADLTFNGTYKINTMQPSGTLELKRYTLPNGNSISGELYCDPMEKGFMCFVPQLFLGDQVFTALQAEVVPSGNSFNINFSLNDYSHSDFDSPGQIEIDAIFSTGARQELQSSLYIKNLFLDSIMKTVAFFLDKEAASGINDSLSNFEPFVFTNEIYLSTDFKSFTFNSPYSLIVNTNQKKQFLLLSFDGNESQVSVSQLELIFDEQTLKASCEVDISPKEEMILFNTDLSFNSLPYHFTGDLKNYKWLNIAGDYDFECALNFENGISGRAGFESLPFKAGDFIFSFTSDVVLDISAEKGINVDIKKLEAEEISQKILIQPKLAFSGLVNNSSFVISSAAYSDNLGLLEGSGEILWNFNEEENFLDSITASLNLENKLTAEKFAFSGDFTNPLKVPFEGEHIQKDFSLNAIADITSFPLGRFMQNQAEDDTLSASLTASGTLENPLLTASISGLSMFWNGSPLIAKGLVQMENKVIVVPEMECEWSGMKLRDTNLSFSLEDFNGSGSTLLSLGEGKTAFYAPLDIQFKNLSENKKNLDTFQADFDCPSITGVLLSEKLPVHISVMHVPGRTDFTSGSNLGLTGWVLDDGQLNFEVTDDKALHFKFFGNTDGPYINFNVTDVSADLSRLSKYLSTPYFSVYRGLLFGNLVITGLGTDPDISGVFTLDEFDFNMPDYIPEHITSKQVVLSFTQDDIELPLTNFSIKDTGFDVSAQMVMDRWTMESLDIKFVSGSNRGIPVDIKIPLVRFKGELGIDLSMTLKDNDLSLDGNLEVENAEFNLLTDSGTSSDLSMYGSSSEADSGLPLDMNMNLKLLIGKKVNIVLPIIRSLIAPDTQIDFAMNSDEETWNLKGDVVLRGGEVLWLNRNFYIKEGRLSLNETQNRFDPSITVRAETRERDEDGDPVTISLSAIRQNTSNFHPVLTSNPAKSENEIMTILGQIVTGDSSNVTDVLWSTADTALQVTLVRKIENALRDFFNFDIFSVRTMILQNALKQSLNTQNQTAENNSLGNYFDNTTVYIGKYFGSELYADALLQWTYDSSKDNGTSMVSGLVFQPELGFELSAPFANIRWNFAPDLGALQSSWVPATSITLSWKFNF